MGRGDVDHAAEPVSAYTEGAANLVNPTGFLLRSVAPDDDGPELQRPETLFQRLIVQWLIVGEPKNIVGIRRTIVIPGPQLNGEVAKGLLRQRGRMLFLGAYAKRWAG